MVRNREAGVGGSFWFPRALLNFFVVIPSQIFNKHITTIMKLLLVVSILAHTAAFTIYKSPRQVSHQQSKLFVSTGNIGLGPAEEQQEVKELVEGVDYEVPNHEEYRTSRRSKLDEQCDKWFGALLEAKGGGVLGELSDNAHSILTTPVELKNEASK